MRLQVARLAGQLSLLLCVAQAWAGAPPKCAITAPVADVIAPHPLWCLPTAVVAVAHTVQPTKLTPRDLAKNVQMFADGTTIAEIGAELDRLGIGWVAFHAAVPAVGSVLRAGATALIAVVPKPPGHHALVVDGAACCPAKMPLCGRMRAMDPALGVHRDVAERELVGAPWLLLQPKLPAQQAAVLVALRGATILAKGRVWPGR